MSDQDNNSNIEIEVKSNSLRTTSVTVLTQDRDQDFLAMDHHLNPFAGKKVKKVAIETEEKSGDPLRSMKKGMLMSTYELSPSPPMKRTEAGGPDQSFMKMAGALAGDRKRRNRNLNNSTMASKTLIPISS